ncbi:MAG TPA: hypothetical protein VFS20_18570 [Longimicrobium sp.]|nr:hypothetical protein [Longimicrobium sp.]
MNRPTETVLAELHEQLAEIARETARLLVQSQHDSTDVEALDLRAAALRARIAAARPRPENEEAIELRAGYGGSLLSGG